MNKDISSRSTNLEQPTASRPAVAVVGMGYVGLTFASLLATHGYQVRGVEKNPRILKGLQRRELHLLEPGIGNAIQTHMGLNWTVAEDYQCSPDIAVICVSTPVNHEAVPDLSNLREACAALAGVVGEGALVIVRSTVPVGTTRRVVLPYFSRKKIRLAFCPERTIQGQALRELTELPQVIGGLDSQSLEAVDKFFASFVAKRMAVSSLEAAEMVKLVNNCHTDVIYSYGNEVALIAREFGLDPLEVIDAANIGYPRPDLAKPGFVGGACLTKDPYILFASIDSKRCSPKLIRSARELNERMPMEVAEHLLRLLESSGKKPTAPRIFVCGFAYKGVPETDDIRGSAVIPFLDTVRARCSQVMGHDYVVGKDIIESYGVQPVSLEEGFCKSDAVVFLNNHKRYEALDLGSLLSAAPRPMVLYDCWRIFSKDPAIRTPGVHYAGIGYEAI